MAKNKKLATFIESALFKSNPVHSTSFIDHKVRTSLELTNDEYVLASLIEKLEKQEKEYNYDRIYNHIGMDPDMVNFCSASLLKKKIIRVDKEKERIVVGALWIDAHKSIENENFEKFYDSAYGKSWPGSKPLAKEAYMSAVAKVGHEYLLQQKLAYFKFLVAPENKFRQTMQASEFLSAKSERYAENWEDYLAELPSQKAIKGEENVKPSSFTIEKKRKLYEE